MWVAYKQPLSVQNEKEHKWRTVMNTWLKKNSKGHLIATTCLWEVRIRHQIVFLKSTDNFYYLPV